MVVVVPALSAAKKVICLESVQTQALAEVVVVGAELASSVARKVICHAIVPSLEAAVAVVVPVLSVEKKVTCLEIVQTQALAEAAEAVPALNVARKDICREIVRILEPAAEVVEVRHLQRVLSSLHSIYCSHS